MSDMFSLQGKVAIVTGGSSGIGFAIANGLVGAGATVFGLGRSDAPKEKTVKKFLYKKCNILDSILFEKICDDIFQDFGSLDILINAAGISTASNLNEDSFTVFNDTLNTNLTAIYQNCEIVKNYMSQSDKGGSIINLTSIASFSGFPNNPGYAASKGGLRMLTKALAVDYASKKIRVNNIAPGYIKTLMTQESYNNEEAYLVRKKHTILDRWGTSDDLLGAAIFLSSSASNYVTGIDLVVDGGWLAKGMNSV